MMTAYRYCVEMIVGRCDLQDLEPSIEGFIYPIYRRPSALGDFVFPMAQILWYRHLQQWLLYRKSRTLVQVHELTRDTVLYDQIFTLKFVVQVLHRMIT